MRLAWTCGLVLVVCAVALTTFVLLGRGETASAGAGEPVTVSPLPGTPTASAETQISLRGVAPEAVGTIEVAGSQSGAHSGRLLAHSDGEGASFVLDERFAEGERVTVSTGLSVRDARDGDFTFEVARTAPHGSLYVKTLQRSPASVQRFVSERRLRPPRVTVTRRARGTAPGYVFAAPKGGPSQDGVMIFDNRGDLVWFQPMPGREQATSFRVQSYGGRPSLTWWQGRVLNRGYGLGDYVIADRSYRRVRTIEAGNGYRGDHHEFVVTARDTAFVTIYQPVRWDLSEFGGPENGVVWDSILQEIDIETGLVLFEWHSMGEVGMDESHSPVPERARRGWDYFHINSIEEDANGDLLVSARNTHAVYLIDHETGAVIWRLGGKRSDFSMGRGTRFAWQHDAHRARDGTITVFDNEASPALAKQSRGIVLRLDMKRERATLARSYTHRPPLLAANQSNLQPLVNGNAFVGWGPEGHMTEFDRRGATLFDARFPAPTDSYRAFRMSWSGRPADRPALAIRARRGVLTVYASWNGATGVSRWEVLAGATAGRLRPVGSARRSGFETRVAIAGRPRWIAVRARSASGRVLGTSRAVRR